MSDGGRIPNNRLENKGSLSASKPTSHPGSHLFLYLLFFSFLPSVLSSLHFHGILKDLGRKYQHLLEGTFAQRLGACLLLCEMGGVGEGPPSLHLAC